MSGHSKWATIKHAKGAADAKRGQMFTKLTREIILASKEGGPSPDMNARLRLAIQKAKDNRMPSENIERAIKKGSGATGGENLVEMVLEGYGPGGVAVLVSAVSDNRNRAVAEVRHLFTRSGGALGESGCVSWIFEQRGVITVDPEGRNVENLELEFIDLGAEDISVEGGLVEVYTARGDLEKIRKALEQKNFKIESSELAMHPKTSVELDDSTALRVLALLEKLDELDDVQLVSSNTDFTPEVLAKYESQS